MLKNITESLSLIFTNPPPMGTYMDILIVLSLLLSILIIARNNQEEEDKNISSDVYNLSIGVIIIAFLTIIGIILTNEYALIPTFILYAALPITLPILVLALGTGNEIKSDELGVAIATLCVTIYYMIVSGMISQLVDIEGMSAGGRGRSRIWKSAELEMVPLRKSGRKRGRRRSRGFGFGSIFGF